MKRIRVLALASYPVEAASSRHRIAQFIEPLARRGIDVTFSPFLDATLFAALYEPRKFIAQLPRLALRTLLRLGTPFRAARADVVLIQREAMLFGPPLIEAMIRRPIVLDLDDATWISSESPVYGRLASLVKWPAKAGWLIRRARIVTCGSPNVAAYAESCGSEAVVIPTVVDTRRFRPRASRERGIPPREGGITTIGWIGTHSTFKFVERLLPLFERLAHELPFRLMIVGSGRDDIRIPGVDVETRAWTMEREIDDFQSIDIGIYPIADDEWSAGKSGFKAVQYLATGVPFVMSPVGVCATMGAPGRTHFCAITDEEWLDALRRLVADAALRERMSIAGRAFAEAHYDVEPHADALAAAIRKCV
jgi:glycosyltransferase involved in cell wall biosynthesis